MYNWSNFLENKDIFWLDCLLRTKVTKKREQKNQ